MIQIGEPEVIVHPDGHKTISTRYEISTETREHWDRIIEWRRLMDYEPNMIKGCYATPTMTVENPNVGFKIAYKTFMLNNGKLKRYKSHKPKDKTMWIKSEDEGCLLNLKQSGSIIVHLSEGKQCVMTSMGYGHKTIKSFKYKEDAEKYLDELLEKLNDED